MKLPSTSQRRTFFVRVISGVVQCHTGNRYAATVPFSAMELLGEVRLALVDDELLLHAGGGEGEVHVDVAVLRARLVGVVVGEIGVTARKVSSP